MSDTREDESKRTPGKRFAERPRNQSAAAHAGSTLSGAVIGCLLIGYLVGDYTDSNPTAVLVGLFVGIVVGMYNLGKQMLKR